MFKSLIICTVVLFVHTYVIAQDLSLQISPGIMNYGGDLENKVYTFQHANFSVGANLAYRVDKFSLRAGITVGSIHGDDYTNTNYIRRNLDFSTGIFDASLSLQYDLFSMDEHKFTPYVFAGIGAFHFNPYTYYGSQKVYLRPLGTEGQGLALYPDRKLYSLTQFEMPYGIGFKYKLSDRVLIGLEFSSRFLFTDYLDDVSNRYPDEAELFKQRGQLAVDLSFRGNEIDPSLPFPSGERRGNPKRNDNYYTSSFSFMYVFPKHTNFNGSGGKQKRNFHLSCPKAMQ